MSFYDEVYKLCKRIPKGKISTYKIIGNKLGNKAYRAVGQALRNNPNPIKTPCHRIVNSKGCLHGFNGEKSSKALNKKAKLLEEEGVKVKNNKIVDFEKKLFRF